jgi:endonuclease/exonuclease/phosphatase family metal-dependent hydrolase
MALRLLLQNCYWTRIWNKGKRFRYIREEIEYFNPDVVCLQEVVFRTDNRHVKIDELTPHKMRSIWSNRGGLVTMVRDDQIEEGVWNKYKHQGSIMSWQIAERIMGKGFSAVKLKRNCVWIINTHLSANFSLIEKSRPLHISQIEQILQFVEDKEEVILAGDFNFTPFSDAYRLLSQSFEDCSTHLSSTYPRKAQTLDYVFYKGSRYKLSHSTLLRYDHAPFRISDHFGLVVELTNQTQVANKHISTYNELQTNQ